MPRFPIGDILGGIAEVGGSGAAGAFQGQVEGEQLRRQFQNQDLVNRLHVLDAMLKGQHFQQGQQPQASIHGNRVLVKSPTGQYAIQDLPPTPPTDLQRAQTESAKATAGWRGAQQEHLLQEKTAPAKAPAAKSIIQQVEEQVMTSGLQSLSPGQRAVWDAHHRPQKPAAGLAPRVTTTENFKYTPRKDVVDQGALGKIDQAVNQTVNEIASNPNIQGWMQPGAMVRIAGYPVPVRREDVIADRLFKRTGIHVAVRWDPSAKRWMVTRAWEGGDREVSGGTRTVGPPKSQPAESEAEGDEGE